MRYTLTIAGHSELAHLFKQPKAYDDRELNAIARANKLKLTRSNGDSRYRGSRRLLLWTDNLRRPIAQFDMEKAPLTAHEQHLQDLYTKVSKQK